MTDDAQKLIAELTSFSVEAERIYWRLRSYLDNNVEGWVHGDDGPAYPAMRASGWARKQAKQVEDHATSVKR